MEPHIGTGGRLWRALAGMILLTFAMASTWPIFEGATRATLAVIVGAYLLCTGLVGACPITRFLTND